MFCYVLRCIIISKVHLAIKSKQGASLKQKCRHNLSACTAVIETCKNIFLTNNETSLGHQILHCIYIQETAALCTFKTSLFVQSVLSTNGIYLCMFATQVIQDDEQKMVPIRWLKSVLSKWVLLVANLFTLTSK